MRHDGNLQLRIHRRHAQQDHLALVGRELDSLLDQRHHARGVDRNRAARAVGDFSHRLLQCPRQSGRVDAVRRSQALGQLEAGGDAVDADDSVASFQLGGLSVVSLPLFLLILDRYIP